MPVLLTREEEFQTWLSGSADEAFALAREYPPEQMHMVQEGFDKEDLLGAQPVVQSSGTLL
jgi:putative SOS response-associated peptidase YedK